jgi:hypothetical protein
MTSTTGDSMMTGATPPAKAVVDVRAIVAAAARVVVKRIVVLLVGLNIYECSDGMLPL